MNFPLRRTCALVLAVLSGTVFTVSAYLDSSQPVSDSNTRPCCATDEAAPAVVPAVGSTSAIADVLNPS